MLTPSVVALPSFSCRGAFLKAWAPKRLNGHASQLQRGPNRSVATNWIKDSQWLNATSPKVVGAAERQVFVEKIESLRRGILASNWGDSFQFVLNVPFWEAIFEGLHTEVRSVPNLLHDADVARNWVSMSTLMDFMFVCEDLRDHLNELIEFLDRTNSRDSGCSQRLENLNEHITAVTDRYDVLENKFPVFAEKLHESVGKGINLLRQRYRFNWKGQHAAYY